MVGAFGDGIVVVCGAGVGGEAVGGFEVEIPLDGDCGLQDFAAHLYSDRDLELLQLGEADVAQLGKFEAEVAEAKVGLHASGCCVSSLSGALVPGKSLAAIFSLPPFAVCSGTLAAWST